NIEIADNIRNIIIVTKISIPLIFIVFSFSYSTVIFV
ncbi:putative membrane protein, partial [Chlamydia psittaci 02DC14]